MIAFHVAPVAARGAIARVGLLAAGPRPRAERYGIHQQPAGVYVWKTLERALRWAEDFSRLYAGAPAGRCDVYLVELADLTVLPDPDPSLAHQGALYTPGDVEPRRLSRYLDVDGAHAA